MLLRAWNFVELEEGASHRTSEGDAEQQAAGTRPVSHTVASALGRWWTHGSIVRERVGLLIRGVR